MQRIFKVVAPIAAAKKSSTQPFPYEFPGNLKEFEDLLKCILQKNSIKEYVVVQDTESENTLALLKHGDIEQLGHTIL